MHRPRFGRLCSSLPLNRRSGSNRRVDAYAPLRAWGRAFAVASVVHLLLPDYDAAEWRLPQLLNLVGVAWLLWRPSRGGFALCCLATLWPLLFLRDVLTQSTLLALWAGIATIAPGRARDAVRWTTGLTYLMAAFHKLNSAYLDPQISCAPHAWAQFADRWALPGAPPFVAEASIVLEVVLALLVLRRSPWMWPLGLAFHLPLTVTLAPAFGAVMLSGYVAATSPRQAVHWRRTWRGRRPWILAVALLFGLADLAFAPGWPNLKAAAVGGLLVWSVASMAPARAPLRPGWAAGLLWVLWCLTPYLGWQVQHTAAMLSNLRVDPECHNHLLMPAGVAEDPYLRVESASIPTRPKRSRRVEQTLWNVPALHTMHRNWCIPEQRPIRLTGTWRGAAFSIPDLCDEDWLRHLPGAELVPPGLQRFQKNLARGCSEACVH